MHWLLHLQNYIRKLQLFIDLQILKNIMHYEKNKMNVYIHDSLNQAVRRKKNIQFLLYIEGSDYLLSWFGKGIESRLRLQNILPCHISFTIGDSGAEFKKYGNIKLLTMEDIREQLLKYDNNFDTFMEAI